MRIAHFLLGRCRPDSANGVDRSVYHLTRSQAALGHEVGLFCLTAKPPIPIDGVTVRGYPASTLPTALPTALLAELRGWRPDLVHLHSAYVPANATLARVLRRWGVPYVVTPHGGLSRHVLRRRAYLKVPYRALFELPTLNRAAFVHALADDADIRAYGVTAPLVVAPNGIDHGEIPRDPDRGVLVRRFPRLSGKTVALFLGRLDPLHKGLDLLVEAFAVGAAPTGRMALVLVGPDWRGGQERLARLATRLGVGEQVIFWGPAYGREKYDLLASADLFVHTSRWEGIPFSVLEAIASGKPCLVTPAADPLGLIGASEAGFVVEPRVDAIAAALRRVALLERELLESAGRRAAELAQREFSWTRTARTLVDGYARYATEPR